MPTPPPATTALVTGASSGIGRALAVGLGRAGLAVALLGRDVDRLAEVAEEVRATGARCATASADTTDYGDLASAVAEIQTLDEIGPVDLLVDSAGVIEPEEVPVWEADPQHWRRVVEVDLIGAFHAVRAVVPGMLERGGGRVVQLNSGAGIKAAPVGSAYNAAKTGLWRIGGAVHLAGFEKGLRAFELAPGVVDTPMTRSMPHHAGRTRWTDPADVVALVVAMARGDLDAWSGRMVRAGADTPASLAAREAAGPLGDARTLGLRPWGDDDPLG